MKQLFRILPIFILTSLLINSIYCQDWKREKLRVTSDSLIAKYSWTSGNNYHSAWGKLSLFKNGRYKYSSFYPFSDEEKSEGIYKIHGSYLLLNSDFQPNQVKVKVNYLDTIIKDSSFKKLNYAKNNQGQIIYSTYYSINNDTTLEGRYDPALPFNSHLLMSINSIKVFFNNNDFSSPWIPIEKNNKFIEVVILTEKDLDNYKNKVFTNHKFKITKFGLKELSNEK